MRFGLAILGSLGLGAGLMYVLDPDRGTTRRALIRGKGEHLGQASTDRTEGATRDLGNRATGLLAAMRARLLQGPVSDEVLVDRVRSAIGRAVSHPSAILVVAQDGRVTVSGQVLDREVDALLDAVRTTPGVAEIEEQLETHEQAGNIPNLQGGEERLRRRERVQESWPPGIRLLAGSAGGLLMLTGMVRRGMLGGAMSLAGATLVARSVTNMPARRLAGRLTRRRGITVQKTVNLDVPLEQVFRFWSRPEAFPRVMAHVKEVRPIGEGRYHWVVETPAGIAVSWDARITKRVENKVLAWRSVPGAMVENAGCISFQANPDGTTRLDIQMAYHPPAGVIGHGVASLLGSDPKHLMEVDLGVLKALVEEAIRSQPGDRPFG